MTDAAPPNEELRALAEAAAWRAALSEDGTDPDALANEAFQDWLGKDQNALAWRQVQAGWDYFDTHAIDPEMMALRRDALDRANRARAARHAAPRRWDLGRRQMMPRAAAAGILLAFAGFAGARMWQAGQTSTYSTALGERRDVALADGSKIALDSGSVLTVRLGRQSRQLVLLSGQARFDVAHDAARPFTVLAGAHTVTATGTSFNVDLIGDRFMVTLMQGNVVVARAPEPDAMPWRASAPAAIEGRLSAGQVLIAARGAAPLPVTIEAASPDVATAWQDGQLIFRHETLEHAAERVSRYSKQLVVADASARFITLSGVFAIGDVAHFIDAVQGALPVRATSGPDGAVHLLRRERAAKG